MIRGASYLVGRSSRSRRYKCIAATTSTSPSCASFVFQDSNLQKISHGPQESYSSISTCKPPANGNYAVRSLV